MPELAEVQVICNFLQNKILNKSINHVKVLLPRIIRNTEASSLLLLEGDCFTCIERRGKYILLTTKHSGVLLIHLRMTGRLVYYEPGAICEDAYERVRFQFQDGSYCIYGDTRTLGAIYYFRQGTPIDIKGFLYLGLEPLSEGFTADACYKVTRGKRTPIKTFLLQQQHIAGLGNIYADESLFAAGISPLRETQSLSYSECERLQQEIQRLLTNSIARGGTTFRDYRNGSGGKGTNQNYLCVYGRRGKLCKQCGHRLHDMTIGGRTTIFCPQCQR